MKKFLILLVVALLVIGFFALDLNRYLTLEGLKASLSQFEAQRAAAPVAVGLAFFGIYVAVTALSLPGAAILTLAAGALFGLAVGTLIVSFASSLGATLAFLASRYVLRDAIQRRFGDRLKAINEGIAKDGPLYLFTLRLVPVFPFFLVNLLMGLTPIRTTGSAKLACSPARWCMSMPAHNWPRSPACRALCLRACCFLLHCWACSPC